MEASEAIRRSVEALKYLAGADEPEVDQTGMTVCKTTFVPWRSFGEYVVVSILPHEGGSMLEVTSEPATMTLVDYGKNQGHVRRVIQRLSTSGNSVSAKG